MVDVMPLHELRTPVPGSREVELVRSFSIFSALPEWPAADAEGAYAHTAGTQRRTAVAWARLGTLYHSRLGYSLVTKLVTHLPRPMLGRASILKEQRPDDPYSRTSTPWVRFLTVFLVAALAAAAAYGTSVGESVPRDFDQVGYAAGALLEGRNPYAEIGPGRAFHWDPFYYPLTAPVAILPLAWLPRPLLNAAFTFIGAALFGWVLTRRGLGFLVFFASAAALHTATVVQWSWLFAASAGLPVVGLIFAAKPTLGAAMFAARPSWWPIFGGALLLTISLAFQPDWLIHWRAALNTTTFGDDPSARTPYLSPLTRPGGVVVLLALLRWRRPEARLVAALGAIPQSPFLYETVPLFLVARSWSQAAALTVLSWVAWTIMAYSGPFDSRLPRYLTYSSVILWCMYLPCVLLVLRRPNEGRVPAWLDGTLTRWRVPSWLAGRPPAEES